MIRQTVNSLLAACVVALALAPSVRADSAEGRARRLVGTWTVQNETTDPQYARRTPTGQVTFAADGTMTVDEGGFAAAGIVNGSARGSCHRPQAPISFKVLGAGAKQKVYLSWTGAARKAPTSLYPQDAVLDVVKLTRNEMILAGQGGCGDVGAVRISYLTRVR